VITWHRAQGVAAGVAHADTERALGGSMFAAFRQVVSSPYLLGIALFVMFLTWVSTFLYLEQQAYVAKAFATRDERTQFFATVDFWVQAVSLVTQLLVFARLFKWFGFRVMLVSVPILMTIGYGVFALYPSFMVLVVVFAIRRVGEYGITRPCRDSLFTVVTREEKYKAKSLIDTFVYRGGDALSGSLYKALTTSLGAGPGAIGWVGAGISALWTLQALVLGRAQENRATGSATKAT
jgi:AAA family ATP:ADP antiporter